MARFTINPAALPYSGDNCYVTIGAFISQSKLGARTSTMSCLQIVSILKIKKEMAAFTFYEGSWVPCKVLNCGVYDCSRAHNTGYLQLYKGVCTKAYPHPRPQISTGSRYDAEPDE